MKKSSNLFTAFSSNRLKELTTVVVETLAKSVDQLPGKTFTAADLWNIQRQGKTRTQRRVSI